MRYARQLFLVVGISGAVLQIRKQFLAPPAGTPQAMVMPMRQAVEDALGPQQPKAEQAGTVSWYGPARNETGATSRKSLDQNGLTAADPKFPLCTEAVGTSWETAQSVEGTLDDGDISFHQQLSAMAFPREKMR